MERERATTDQKVETFLAPNLIGLSTVQNLQKGVLNVTIMHNFGLINDEPFKNFFGLDQGVNVRLGLDYGLTDNWSVGLARTTDGKLYHFRTKYS
ncbi:MAG: DUF5777 family beta-barrel protein, partial [Balneolaceae bacterium]|nr:DUF5777 family beta-barrel protein [Balneolaceae bacterium]